MRHPGHLLTHGSLQLLQPQLLSAPLPAGLLSSKPACPGGGRLGGIRLCSYLRETTSPSLLIKFPQPLRLVGAGRQTALQAGGENKSQWAEPPAVHLHRGGRAPPQGPAKAPQLPVPLPSEGLQLPGSKAPGWLRSGRGRMLGFSRADVSSTRVTRSAGLSVSPGLLAVPQPSADLETSLDDILTSMLELSQDHQGQRSKIY